MVSTAHPEDTERSEGDEGSKSEYSLTATVGLASTD